MIECIFVVQICCYSKCGVVLEELNPHLPLTFWLSSPSFSTTFQMWLGLPHPSIACIPWCMCTHPINVTSLHILCCAHGNEHMSTHDVVHDTFVAIAWDANFHVGQEQLHLIFSTSFHSFCRWIDVVFTKNGICILINVVIANPTQADLFWWSCATWRFIAFKIVQAKKRSYDDWHPTNHFLPLILEAFGCLDKQTNVFLHDCVNVMWNFKGPKGLPIFVLVIFLCKKISITLQKMQASSILNRAVAIGLNTSQLPPFNMHPPSPRLTSYKRLVVETKRF